MEMSRKKRRRRRLLLIVPLLVLTGLVLLVELHLSPYIRELARNQAVNAASNAIIEAVSEMLRRGDTDFSRVIVLEKDVEGHITALRTDMTQVERLKIEVLDILGGLMGLGLTREKLGDILLPQPGICQVIALREALPILLSQWDSAGRWRLKLREIPLDQLSPSPAQVKTIRDTVATLRLDAVVAAGFISAGRVAVNHRECLKADKPVAEGDTLTCRGLGKCVLTQVLGESRKGRIMVVLERYI